VSLGFAHSRRSLRLFAAVVSSPAGPATLFWCTLKVVCAQSQRDSHPLESSQGRGPSLIDLRCLPAPVVPTLVVRPLAGVGGLVVARRRLHQGAKRRRAGGVSGCSPLFVDARGDVTQGLAFDVMEDFASSEALPYN